MNKQDFINAGFSVVDGQNNESKLLKFIKENYPSVIKDNEINLQELKAVLGLPVDEKVNGYGLNFVGRNVARAKYALKTQKELKLNTAMSKNIDTTQNLVLKGDNLDCLKIFKSYYSGKIKCIYIDPPYNTDSDEFVYPDKFDREEAEVLGLTNSSEDDFARMEFSFKTKKSHNGWLSFMYTRLLLARDLFSDEGVIFISIDDNEQANLKLLCDEIFG
ncbi:MAG TPA: site-specific DNA-methyltransferase, partial [Ignavibacteriales bacterium]|nr:site-specific DNA-methyltransferase [Ignavibacteriales bacterium]